MAHFWFAKPIEDRIHIEWLERGDTVQYCTNMVKIEPGQNANDVVYNYLQSLDSSRIYQTLQAPSEFKCFVDLLIKMNVKSYLEVGSRYGGAFEAVMDSLPGAKGTVVDLPGDDGKPDESFAELMKTMHRLNDQGRDVRANIGDSGLPEVVAAAKSRGPYDCVMIDADHSYEGVKRDFDNYADMGKIVALHDIVNPTTDVPKFWNEIKSQYKSAEIVVDGSCMGIGVIFK